MSSGGLSKARLGRMRAILMAQRLYGSITLDIDADFWTLVYQAIDD